MQSKFKTVIGLVSRRREAAYVAIALAVLVPTAYYALAYRQSESRASNQGSAASGAPRLAQPLAEQQQPPPSLVISPAALLPPKVLQNFGWKSVSAQKSGLGAAQYWALLQSEAPDAPFLAVQKRQECGFALMDHSPSITAQVRVDAHKARKALCADWTRESFRASNSVSDAQLYAEGAKRGDLAARLAMARFDKGIDPQIIIDLAAEGVKTQHAGFFVALGTALANPQAQQRLRVVGYPVATHYGHIAYSAELLACQFGTECGSGSMFRLAFCYSAGWLCGNEDAITELTRTAKPEDRTVILDILARLRLALQTGTNPVSF